MALDLEEQEQLANLKTFWHKYGKQIITVLVIILLGYSANMGWKWWKNSQANEASKLYETLLNSTVKNDLAQTYLAAEDLQKKFGSTAYAAMGSLVAARVASDANDSAKAQQFLRWTAKDAADDSYRAIAQMRLVSLLIDQGGDAAMSEADQLLKTKPVNGFEALWLERRGDWYLTQQKISEARSSYQEAWKILLNNKEFPEEAKRLLKVKLDVVGGAS
ncbi:MAG: tetratricopeptide repeat protein [Polynucleobacter sp.]|jgi:predicted negative regulator of RcsB-dependent stress response|nr:tetratricopeptide repeat protein [Polynucleobacter sp.]